MGINFFNRDVRDSKFVIFEHLGVNELLTFEAFRDFSGDDIQMIIEEGHKVAREMLGPTLQDGDRVGCRYRDGEVEVPPAFHEGWNVLGKNGWVSLCSNPEFGGQGLPQVLGGIVTEFFHGANPALTLYAELTAGAGRLIENFGGVAEKARFVEKMYAGQWGGTMCLTESDAGSDVGWVRTKATPESGADPHRIFKIEGNKQYISGGQQDLTENIIHLVLGRIEGAPLGTKGLSLFIVPKIWVEEDGSLGPLNDVFCAGIEHKMGMHGAATCSMNFGEKGQCRGIMLGEPGTGINKMFQMMNEARIMCGLQALGVAASAYDTARQYAKERIQGTPFRDREGGRVAIIQHEDVRRMLMKLKAGTEGMRALVGKTFYLLDLADHAPEEETRLRSEALAGLLIPVVKSYCTDFSYQLIRDAIQVLGGAGYCNEFPVEQYERDCKVLSIVEGTNYIQALDFISRKMPLGKGLVFNDFVNGVQTFCAKHGNHLTFGGDFKVLSMAGCFMAEFSKRREEYLSDHRFRLVPLYATRFLDCFGEFVLSALLLEQGLIAERRLKEVNPESADGIFYQSKVHTAQYFCRNILTNVFGRQKAFDLEDTSALDVSAAAF
jgi:3-(methylthio)propanoyl-CoA dehydrogenase